LKALREPVRDTPPEKGVEVNYSLACNLRDVEVVAHATKDPRATRREICAGALQNGRDANELLEYCVEDALQETRNGCRVTCDGHSNRLAPDLDAVVCTR